MKESQSTAKLSEPFVTVRHPSQQLGDQAGQGA